MSVVSFSKNLRSLVLGIFECWVCWGLGFRPGVVCFR